METQRYLTTTLFTDKRYVVLGFFLPMIMQKSKSGSIVATYNLIEPHLSSAAAQELNHTLVAGAISLPGFLLGAWWVRK